MSFNRNNANTIILLVLLLVSGKPENFSKQFGEKPQITANGPVPQEQSFAANQAKHRHKIVGWIAIITHNEGESIMFDINRILPPLPFGKQKARRQLRSILRSKFVELMFSPDGRRPFSFAGRRYLIPIYDQRSNQTVMMCSRQSEKTTTVGNDMLMDAVTIPGDRLLFVSGYKDQVTDIVRQKIEKQFTWNPMLFKPLLGPGSFNSTFEKQFTNGSSMSFRYAGMGADALRGRSVRKVYFDEAQLIPDDNVQVVMEATQAFPDTSAHIFTGTPLSIQNPLCRRYAASKQYEWLITCDHCSYENEPLGIVNVDPKKPFLFCLRCGKQMDPTRGRWVAQNPASKIAGYRICRLMTPTCRWRTKSGSGILDKLQSYSESRFHNEVLGLPFDIGTLPISEAELRACCDDYGFVNPDKAKSWTAGRICFAAIDWAWNDHSGGQSYTIMTIGFRNAENKLQIIYAKRFAGVKYHNPDSVIAEIVQTLTRFNVQVVGSDFGIGHKENLRLRKLLPNLMIVEMQYVNMIAEQSYDQQARVYKLPRSRCIDRVIDDLKQGKIRMPRWEESRSVLTDCLNIYVEQDQNLRSHRYIHSGLGPDDFLHLLVYLKVLINHYYH